MDKNNCVHRFRDGEYFNEFCGICGKNRVDYYEEKSNAKDIEDELNNAKYGRMIMGIAEKMSGQLPIEKTREMLKVRKVIRGKSI
jgi:hypothetical protein